MFFHIRVRSRNWDLEKLVTDADAAFVQKVLEKKLFPFLSKHTVTHRFVYVHSEHESFCKLLFLCFAFISFDFDFYKVNYVNYV